MTHQLLIRMEDFLYQTAIGPVGIPEKILIEAFGAACSKALEKQFSPKKPFTIRMSNIGMPMCQLKMERDGNRKLDQSYTQPLVFLYGDLLEAALITIMKMAGVNITHEQKKVTLNVGGISLEGTLDIVIEDPGLYGVWDIKTASDFSFNNKFGLGFDTLVKNDPFGYILQGALYGAASGIPFRGWIVINKENGQLKVLEVPDNFQNMIPELIQEVDARIRRLTSKEKFYREFEDVAEMFRKKPTGNRKLDTTCSYCIHKWACWVNVVYMPRQCGDSLNAPWAWYTHVESKNDADTIEEG